MFPQENPFSFRLLAVLDLSWKKDRRFSHVRTCDALSFRVRGGARFLFSEGDYSVSEGDVTFVPAGCSYTLDHKSERLFVVHFTAYDGIDRRFFSVTPKDPALYARLFASVFRVWNAKKTGYYYEAAALFCEILSQLQRETAPERGSSSERLRRVTDYLHTHFTRPDLSVPELAALFGSGETYFRRAFKQATGTTPVKYLRALRIDYARELLRSGYYKVCEAAEKAGFSDPKYFSRVVKKELRLPPSRLL